MLRGGDVKEIYEMHGRGHSARAIARELGLARNTVLKYLHSPEAMLPKPRAARGSLLDPYTEHIDRRMAQGLENCVVLLRELRSRGYQGRYGLRQRPESRPRWTGEVFPTSARMDGSTASGCS